MGNRKSDILLSNQELKELIETIKTVFYQRVKTSKEFRGGKEHKIYEQLQEEIMSCSDVFISTGILRDIMTLRHKGSFRAAIYDALLKYINLLDPNGLRVTKLFWGVNQGLSPGAYIDRIDGEFIPWNMLESELNLRVVSCCPKFIPSNSHVVLNDFYGKKNWVIEVIGIDNKQVASVWIGGNPLDNWKQDGYIRLGKVVNDHQWVVYLVFARYSDGSYRTIKSYI